MYLIYLILSILSSFSILSILFILSILSITCILCILCILFILYICLSYLFYLSYLVLSFLILSFPIHLSIYSSIYLSFFLSSVYLGNWWMMFVQLRVGSLAFDPYPYQHLNIKQSNMNHSCESRRLILRAGQNPKPKTQLLQVQVVVQHHLCFQPCHPGSLESSLVALEAPEWRRPKTAIQEWGARID